MKMYEKIAKLLDNAFGNNWFLDSGSLLGVVRNGNFLSGDSGIDISVIVNDYNDPTIQKVEKEMEALGFISSKYDWGGIVYKFCFVPSLNMKFEYSIDFHIFIKGNDAFKCPQVSLCHLNAIESITTRCKKGNLMYTPSYSMIKKVLLSSFEYFYRYTFRYFKSPIRMRDFAIKNKGDVYFWVIPNNIDFSVDKDKTYGLNYLIHPDSYLTYRYGDWHTPVSDWDTLRDDGGIRKASIKDVDSFLSI